MINGAVNTIATIIGLLGAEYGFGINATSLFGTMAIVGGVVGSGVFGAIVEYRKNYKTVIVVLSFFAVVIPGILLVSFDSSEVWFAAIMSFFVGFIGISGLPLGLDFAVELTYPISESVSGGLMMTSMNLFGALFSIACSALIGSLPENHMGSKLSAVILTLSFVISFVILLFVENDLRRIKLQ